MVPLPLTHFFPMNESIKEALAKMRFLKLDWLGVFCSDPVIQTTLYALMKESITSVGIKLYVQSTSQTELVSPKISLVPFSILKADDTSALDVSSRLIVDYSPYSVFNQD
jgi:hypothetical protein